jgi:DNA-binding NarL/FixJ family response regulator
MLLAQGQGADVHSSFPPTMSKPRILLADDDPKIVESVAVLLEPEFEVVGCVKDGSALVDAARALVPDLIVTDISMPELNGFRAIRRIKTDRPDTRVVFLTVHTDPAFVSEAKTMAAGYVIKQLIPSLLIPAIRRALQDRPCVSTFTPQ